MTMNNTILNHVGTLTADGTYNPVIVMKWTVYNANYTHKLVIKNGSTTILTIEGLTASAGTVYISYKPTFEQLSTILNAMPNMAILSATYELTTYDGTTQIGTVSSCEGKIQTTSENSKPNFSYFSFADINEATLAVTKRNQVMVQSHSLLRVSCGTATARNGASIVKYRVTIGSKTVESETTTVDFGEIDFSGFVTVTVSAVDSRGYTATKTQTIEVLPYEPIKINYWFIRRINEVGEATNFIFNGTYSPLLIDGVENNYLNNFTYRYRMTSGGEWSAWENIEQPGSSGIFEYANNEFGWFDSDYSYEICLCAADQITSCTVYLSLPKGTPLVAYRSKMVGINNNQPTSALDVIGDIKQNGEGVLGMVGILDADFDTIFTGGVYWYAASSALNNAPSTNNGFLMVLSFGVGDAYAFNASDSVLWCNVRDFRSAELATMYKNRETAGCWNPDEILAEFSEYQSARPEALEIEDAHNKYRVTTAQRFRSMMLGTKEYQRDYFIPKQAAYMASKYRSSLCTENKISLRTNVTEGSTAQGDIYGVVPAIKMYLRCQFGNMGEYVVRAEAGQSYTMECPDGSVLNDLETYIFSSKWISKVGSLAHLRPKFVDFSNAPLLTRAEIGSADATLVNTTMNTANTGGISFDNNPLLEYIDLRNIPYLAQPLDLSNLASLEELYTTNSGITGVVFAKGAPLRIAALNSPKQLVALKLDKIESFTMGGGALTSIRVEESPAIDTLALVKAATALERGRLLDVNWADTNPDAILRLTTKAGLNEFGKDAEVFVLTGTAAVNQAAQSDIDTIRSVFSELEISCSELLESFTVSFVDYDGTVLNQQTVRQYGSAVNPITAGYISTPTRASTVDTIYTFIGWDVSFNYVLGDLTVTAVYSEAVRTYTVRWWYDAAQTTLLASVSGVEAYSSVDYPGDVLTSDTGAIWMGWDDLTTSVESDMDVHAVFVSPVMPDTVASGYDYLYSDDPDDNSGYSLAEFYGIVSTGNAKSYFNVGDKIKIVPSTTAFKDNEIVLQVYGFNHFKLADDSGEFAPVVFGMVGLMNANYQMNSSNTNVGGWDVTKMRTYLNETVFPALPVQWQAMIKTVQVLASEGDTSATIVTSKDNLFLFSQAEVGFDTTTVPYSNEVDPDAEQVTFSLFTDNNSRIKKTYNGTGTAAYWWLRSPLASSSYAFCYVAIGGYSSNYDAYTSHSVAFGFCI